MNAPLPSMSFLADFAQRSERSRQSIIRRQREQYESPEGQRFGPQYYVKVISAAIRFVEAGCTGDALERVVENAAPSRVRSFAAGAAGLKQWLGRLRPIEARRGPRLLYTNAYNEPILNVVPHLILETAGDATYACFLHFKEEDLEDDVIDMLLQAMSRACGPDVVPAVVLVRRGELIDGRRRDFDRPGVVARIEYEVATMRALWDVA